QKVTNPQVSGINTSDHVGEFSHSGNNWWAGIASTELSYTFDFAQTPYFRMKVYAAQPIYILFKLENAADGGINSEVGYQMTADQTNQWTELVFNFSGVTVNDLNKVVLFFDPGQDHSEAGTKYYFDDITASSVPPAVNIAYSPENEANGVELFSQCEISTNFSLQMIDDSALTDLSTIVWLKETDANGADVPFTASLSNDQKKITIIPNDLLSVNTVYSYGIYDNLIEYAETQVVVENVSASFTTRTTQPSLQLYDDFDGNSVCSVVETMGDPASPYAFTNDPAGGTNQVLQWDKGGSWWGWERIHFELEKPISIDGDNLYELKIFAPKTGYVRLKIANQKDENGAIFVETDANFTKINEWETLYFKFSGTIPEADYTHLFIYIDGGSTDAVTYYIDEVKGPDLITDADGDGVDDEQDACPDTPEGTAVDLSGCPVVVLPFDNFSMEATGESCAGKANGQLVITAQETYDYVATIDGTDYPFTNNSLSLDNLASGSYEVCISITGENYQQCFTVTIAAGSSISGKATTTSNKVHVTIDQGTAPYTVYINQQAVLKTKDTTFELAVKHGDLLEVKTDIDCEGTFSKTMELLDGIALYPNPTRGAFDILLPMVQSEVTIELFNNLGQQLSAKTYPVISGKVQVQLGNKPKGLYFVKINLASPITLKIIKQ
ncbi:MAG: T9SS type A sorting domain-containing protein, partial [Lutibacter sp.]|nr:T9SS type A sorting domain-containing protein [Lutibacter sp.]